MADISTWSPTDESNTAAPPAGWPENMQPSAVNNSARGMMGAIRRWYDTVTAQLASLTTSLGNYLPLSGGSLTGALSAPQYNISGVPFATIGGGTTVIWDPTGAASGAIHLEASNNYYNADTHIFRNNAITLNTAIIDNVGNLTLAGSYIHFAGSGGAAGTTGGPLIYADAGNHVYKLGAGSGSFLFENYAGAVIASIGSGGNIIANGNITAPAFIGNVTVPANGPVITGGTVTGGAVTSTGNMNAAGTVTAAQLTSTANINAAGTVTAAYIQSTGHIDAATYVYAPDGFWAHDAAGGTTYRMYSSGGFSYLQFANLYAFQWSGASGALNYIAAGDVQWVMRTGDFLTYNALAPVGGLGAYINMSDRRGKTDIVPSTRGLDEILRLSPVSFQRVSRVADGMDRKELGFVAQDVQDVLPEAVRVVGFTLPDGTGGLEDVEPSLGITDSTIIAALVNAVKELNTRLAALEGAD